MKMNEMIATRRFVLAAGAALVIARPADAATPLPIELTATRIEPGKVKIGWTPATASLDLFIGADPDAPRAKMKRAAAKASGGAVVLDAPTSPRPYFLAQARDGRTVRIAERLLPLAGGRNFRDLGGYEAADGRRVRWGRLYRSGVMASLTPADRTYLGALGIRSICDLRSAQERTSEPTPAFGDAAPAIASFDYDMSRSMAKMFAARTQAEAITTFGDAYVDMTQYLAPNYTDMFARLARGEAPLTVNCSAGKDRTGVASALILSVLGASRETIVADYALSETYVPASLYRDQMRKPDASGQPSRQSYGLGALPDPVLDVLLGSNAGVMRHALARIDAEFGGPVALAKARYGLDDATIARMRTLYLV